MTKTVKRIVDTSFWEDDKVVDMFSPEDKYFMLYLMTNPHTSQVGIYRFVKKTSAFELGHSRETVDVLIERFQSKYKIIKFDSSTSEIAVLNYLKYSIVKGGKPVEDVIKRDLRQIKSTDLIFAVYQHMKKYWLESDRYFDNNVKDIFKDTLLKRKVAKENINDNDNDNDNDNEESYHDSYNDSLNRPSKPVYSLPYSEIVNFLNTKAGTKYHPTSAKTKKLIHARFSEGFKLEDFKTVITKKTDEWLNTDMAKYLRPETLFGTKFESYLNQESVEKVGTPTGKEWF
jgi:uncharacterized phage protein (TIGR02220 family)